MSPSPYLPAPKRFPLELPIQFHPQHDDRWWPGTTRNISANGVLFTAPKRVLPLTPIEMTLQLPAALTGDKSVRLLCLGHVVRWAEPPGSREIQLAATFFDYRLANGKAGPSSDLRQAQLLAARGDVAKLAHRINSLLCIILGNAELLLLEPHNESKVLSYCLQARHATEEAAALMGMLVNMVRSACDTGPDIPGNRGA